MEFPDWVPLNSALFLNPVNWMMVVLMVLLGTIILCMLGGALGTPREETAS